MIHKEEIEYIEHDAVVKDIKGDYVKLTIIDQDDCTDCPAAKLCKLTAADRKNANIFTIRSEYASKLKPGDKVILRGTERMHRRALIMAFVIPAIAIMVVMFSVWNFTGLESLTAVSGLGTMILFYSMLYLLRNKISHQFEFRLIPV